MHCIIPNLFLVTRHSNRLIYCTTRALSLHTQTPAKVQLRQTNSSARKIDRMTEVETILAGKYPAKSHAKRVVEYIKRRKPDVHGVLYLEGQKTRMIEDNDEPQPFR